MINIVDSLTYTTKFIYLLKIIYYNLGGDKMLFQLLCTLFGIEKKSTHKENKKIYKDIKKGRDKLDKEGINFVNYNHDNR